jgi:hypothetical protein
MMGAELPLMQEHIRSDYSVLRIAVNRLSRACFFTWSSTRRINFSGK